MITSSFSKHIRSVIFICISFLIYTLSFAQQHGNHIHNGRDHNEDWPDSLQTITVSGLVKVDSSHFHPLYFLDEGNNGSIDYQLGFGPYWYNPVSGATRPDEGEEVTVQGGIISIHTPPLIVVFEINGMVWRDSTGAPPWSGDWVHKNASDTTFIYCPTDSMDWMGHPPQSMHGMMYPDSMYCQFEEMPVDSMPGMTDSTMFEGYYTENFRDHGNHMRGSGMMMGFNRHIAVRFHYNEHELHRRGLSEETIQVYYLDGNFNWQVISGVSVNTETNTVSMSQNQVRTFYALKANSVTSVKSTQSANLPEDFTLLPNFPNPFNPQTTIRYKLTTDSNITLNIYDIQGRKIITLYQGPQKAGEYSTIWNGTDYKGMIISSGVYFIQLKIGTFTHVRKMTLLK